MDRPGEGLHNSDMAIAPKPIPAFGLYGETRTFPDILHCERLADRAPRHDWQIAPHRHAGLHQFFHFTGPGVAASVEGQRLAIDTPTVLSVPRWAVHAFRFARGARGHVLSIPPDTLPEVLGADAPVAAAIGVWRTVPAPPAIAARFAAIHEEMGGTRPLRDAVMRAGAVEIAAHVLRAAGAAAAGSGSVPPQLAHMRRFEALVARHMRAHWTMAAYAAEVGVTPTHLGRIARAHTGLSAAAYVEARLMQEARRMLAYTRAPVAQVGYALGFDDPAYFSRAFRRHHGMAPRTYRAGRDRASGPA